MKYLMWLLKAAIFFTLFAFALNNQQDATVHFFFGTQWRAPLVLVVLAAFALGLSIGALADVTQKSKSGVFAHFGSREELQIAVVLEYHAKFEEEVFRPALRKPRGLPRLRALVDRCLRRVSAEIESGCIYIGVAVEFYDRPAPVRDADRHHQ